MSHHLPRWRFGRLLSALALLAQAATAQAGLITYQFAGTVSDDSAGRGFNNFAGSFSFDSNSTDGIADPSTGAYAHAGSAFGITLAFDGGGAFTYGSPFNVLVSNDLAGFDQWGLLGQDGSASLGLVLTDFQAQVFSSDALPSQALALASFQTATLAWEADGERLNGLITSLGCSLGCGGGGTGGTGGGADDSIHPVPLPGSLPLAGAALLAMAATGRRHGHG